MGGQSGNGPCRLLGEQRLEHEPALALARPGANRAANGSQCGPGQHQAAPDWCHQGRHEILQTWFRLQRWGRSVVPLVEPRLRQPEEPTALGTTPRQRRRVELDAEVKRIFEDSGGTPRTYGSPRIHTELVEDGWAVAEKTVADSMARQGLVARPKRRLRSLTRPDKAAAPLPDLLKARLLGAEARREVVRGPDRDPHRRGQALLGERAGLGRPTHTGIRPGRPPRRRARHRGAADGSCRARRGRRRRHLSQRQGLGVHRVGLRGGLRSSRRLPVGRSCGVVLR